jgi:hypothetical protein
MFFAARRDGGVTNTAGDFAAIRDAFRNRAVMEFAVMGRGVSASSALSFPI